MKKIKQRKDLSAARQMLEGFKKRKERKAAERMQEIADRIGENPTYTVTGDIQGPTHDAYGITPEGKRLPISTETDRQREIWYDENPRLTKEDKLAIERKLQETETYEDLDIEDMQEGIRTRQNPNFIAPANERLKEKHLERLVELGREKPMYDPSLDEGNSWEKRNRATNRTYDAANNTGEFRANADFSYRSPGQDPDDPDTWWE